MIIVRDIIAHAATRKLEWLMTGLMIHLGLILWGSDDIFAKSKSFSVLASYMSEPNWAHMFIAFGLARLIVLILNGTHIRTSAELRMMFAAVSFVILCMWIWGVQASGFAPTNAVSYKWLAIGELLNIWQASSDLEAKRRSKSKNGSGYSNLG